MDGLMSVPVFRNVTKKFVVFAARKLIINIKLRARILFCKVTSQSFLRCH